MKRWILLAPVFLLLACSVQKRKYQKGFYVERKQTANTKSSYADTRQHRESVNFHNELNPQQAQEPVFSSAGEHPVFQTQKTKSLLGSVEPDSCDVILFRDGKEVNARVTEISDTEIKYKKCDMAEGPDFVSLKNDVFMIRYANGMTEHFKAAAVSPAVPQQQAGNRPPGGINRYRDPSKVHSDAILSLIMGIIGIAFVYYGSIHAIVLATRVLRVMRENPGKYDGEGYARAGLILGIIKLALIFLIIMLAIAGFL